MIFITRTGSIETRSRTGRHCPTNCVCICAAYLLSTFVSVNFLCAAPDNAGPDTYMYMYRGDLFAFLIKCSKTRLARETKPRIVCLFNFYIVIAYRSGRVRVSERDCE